MKGPLTRYFCIDKKCDWEEQVYSIRDGVRCPKCNLPTHMERVNKK